VTNSLEVFVIFVLVAVTMPVPQLSTGVPFDMAADIPVIPPVMVLGLWIIGAAFHFVYPAPLLPKDNSGLFGRVAYFGAVAAFMWFLIQTSSDALEAVNSGVAFTPVGGMTTDVWPYTMSRNPLYAALVALAFPAMAVFNNSFYHLLLMWVMFLYLDIIVIPAEEALLQAHFAKQFVAYAASTPRWFL
jgi:protein-S-isoprenylcysteine O-methyltransferase Ste14